MRFRSSVLLILTIVGVLTMSSCVKNYTCQCVVKYSGAPGLPDSTYTEYKITNNKSGAESVCEEESFEHTDATTGIKVVETCKLY